MEFFLSAKNHGILQIEILKKRDRAAFVNLVKIQQFAN
jgi:hypothetical protein